MIIGPGWMDVKPTGKVAREIRRWAIDTLGKPSKIESIDDIHVTQIFVGGDDRYPIVPNKKRSYACRFNGAELFGDQNNVLVLLLTSPSLQLRFREFKNVGYKHTYPTYEPHITILDPATPEDLNAARNNMDKLRQAVKWFHVQGETWHKTKPK